MASAQLFGMSGALTGTSLGKQVNSTKAQRALAGRRRTVVVKAAQSGPQDFVMKAFGALAAAQMALLPISGPALAVDLIPKSATSQAARDKLNAETSALPGLKETFTPGVDANAIAGDLPDVPGEAKKALGSVKSTIENALPSGLPSNPARQFANRAKQAVNNATSGVDLPNPAKEFANRTKQAVKGAGSDLPNPAKEFANKARSASAEARSAASDIKAQLPVGGSSNNSFLQKDAAQKVSKTAKKAGDKIKAAVPSAGELKNKAKSVASSNPAADYARAKKAVKDKTSEVGSVVNPAKEFAANKVNRAKQAAKSATSGDVENSAKAFANKAKNSVEQVGSDLPNPAKEFANQAKKASDQVKGKAKGINLPVSFVPSLSNRMNLQQDVGFFGGGKQAASKVGDAASDAQSKVAEKTGQASDKVSDVVSGVVDEGKKSFNIFDAGSLSDVKKTLGNKIEEAAAQQGDPAERVTSIGKPGETQEENAERIRIQSENTATPFGDARLPTAGS